MNDLSRLGCRLWFGLGFLALGLLWTLDNMGILQAEPILEWWPIALIAVGIAHLVGLTGRPKPIAAGLWVFAGAWLLAHNLGYWNLCLSELLPVGLVVIGALLVWRSVKGPGARTGGGLANRLSGGSAAQGANPGGYDDTFSGFAMWAGVDRLINSQNFRGGDFTAIMGGATIDLRNAKPVPGGCTLDLFVVMGGIDVIVPDGWTVSNEVFAFMGGVEDSRKTVTPGGSDIVILRGVCFMAGIEIKNKN